MLNFIIYEESKELTEYYKIIILNSLAYREEEFKVYNYENHSKNNTNNIYIISSKKYDTAIEKVKEIRKDNWLSPVIIICDEEKKQKHNNLLILDYINTKENIQTLLKSSILTAYKILSAKKSFNFTFNGSLYKIPYNEILYFEKRNNQNYSNIYTTKENYIIKNTIKEIEEKIDSAYFIKTHRSCIINLCNVTSYDINTNTIYFNDKTIDLVSREKRRFLKEKLLDH